MSRSSMKIPLGEIGPARGGAAIARVLAGALHLVGAGERRLH